MSRRRHGLTGRKQGPAAVLPNSEKSVPQYIYCIQSPPPWAAFISLNSFMGPVDDYVPTN